MGLTWRYHSETTDASLTEKKTTERRRESELGRDDIKQRWFKIWATCDSSVSCFSDGLSSLCCPGDSTGTWTRSGQQSGETEKRHLKYMYSCWVQILIFAIYRQLFVNVLSHSFLWDINWVNQVRAFWILDKRLPVKVNCRECSVSFSRHFTSKTPTPAVMPPTMLACFLSVSRIWWKQPWGASSHSVNINPQIHTSSDGRLKHRIQCFYWDAFIIHVFSSKNIHEEVGERFDEWIFYDIFTLHMPVVKETIAVPIKRTNWSWSRSWWFVPQTEMSQKLWWLRLSCCWIVFIVNVGNKIDFSFPSHLHIAALCLGWAAGGAAGPAAVGRHVASVILFKLGAQEVRVVGESAALQLWDKGKRSMDKVVFNP